MFKYYNPHPKGALTNDCVKRAIHVCTGTDITVISRQLNAFKKVTGAKRFNSDGNPDHFVVDVLNAKKITLEGKTTAEEFCALYSRGRYILAMNGHWSSCVDGDIYDIWNCEKEQVDFAYEIATENYKAPEAKNQIFKYCCTSEEISDSQIRIRIYDGNGAFAERIIPIELTAGYIRCLQDSNYTYIQL